MPLPNFLGYFHRMEVSRWSSEFITWPGEKFRSRLEGALDAITGFRRQSVAGDGFRLLDGQQVMAGCVFEEKRLPTKARMISTMRAQPMVNLNRWPLAMM